MTKTTQFYVDGYTELFIKSFCSWKKSESENHFFKRKGTSDNKNIMKRTTKNKKRPLAAKRLTTAVDFLTQRDCVAQLSCLVSAVRKTADMLK